MTTAECRSRGASRWAVHRLRNTTPWWSLCLCWARRSSKAFAFGSVWYLVVSRCVDSSLWCPCWSVAVSQSASVDFAGNMEYFRSRDQEFLPCWSATVATSPKAGREWFEFHLRSRRSVPGPRYHYHHPKAGRFEYLVDLCLLADSTDHWCCSLHCSRSYHCCCWRCCWTERFPNWFRFRPAGTDFPVASPASAVRHLRCLTLECHERRSTPSFHRSCCYATVRTSRKDESKKFREWFSWSFEFLKLEVVQLLTKVELKACKDFLKSNSSLWADLKLSKFQLSYKSNRC